MSHSILTAPTDPLDSTLIWNLTAWYSTCVMRMDVESLTCAPMKLASIKSSVSATGITMWIVLRHQIGTIWTIWPTEQTRPKLRSMTSESNSWKGSKQDQTVMKLISSLIASMEVKPPIQMSDMCWGFLQASLPQTLIAPVFRWLLFFCIPTNMA